MKKFLLFITVAALGLVFACNDPKEPPDDGMKAKLQAHADSLAKVDSVKMIYIPVLDEGK